MTKSFAIVNLGELREEAIEIAEKLRRNVLIVRIRNLDFSKNIYPHAGMYILVSETLFNMCPEKYEIFEKIHC